MAFAERARRAIERFGPLCAGIDPSPTLLAAWGLDDDVQGLEVFAQTCLEAFVGAVGAIKPQVAFFERHGSAGLAVLERLLHDARAHEVLTIADAKRADIDSTAAAYGDAWVNSTSPFGADAVTVLPYIGLRALTPIFDRARSNTRGVFVVVRSSNPEGRTLQEALTVSGERVEDALLAEIGGLNASESRSIGSIGVVIGATNAPSAVSASVARGIILAPGVGAQGARPDDLSVLFEGCAPHTVFANVSRSLLAEGPSSASLRSRALSDSDALAHALPS